MIFDKTLFTSNLALWVMIMAVVMTAMAVIYSKHKSRIEFVALHKLEQHRDHLNEEWGRLLLEQSTWAGPGRIEKESKAKLGMIEPTGQDTGVIRP